MKMSHKLPLARLAERHPGATVQTNTALGAGDPMRCELDGADHPAS